MINISSAIVTDVVLDVLVDDGDHQISFIKDWYEKQHLGIPSVPRLGPGDTWRWGVSPSVGKNAYEAYRAVTKKFRIKLQLTWKDLKRNDYSYVHLFRLVFVPPHEGFLGAFRLTPAGSYSSIDDATAVQAHWGLPFKAWPN